MPIPKQFKKFRIIKTGDVYANIIPTYTIIYGDFDKILFVGSFVECKAYIDLYYNKDVDLDFSFENKS